MRPGCEEVRDRWAGTLEQQTGNLTDDRRQHKTLPTGVGAGGKAHGGSSIERRRAEKPCRAGPCGLAWGEGTHVRTLEVLSMRDAVLTVSPNRQNRGILEPTTPLVTGPLCMPTRISVGPPVGMVTLRASRSMAWGHRNKRGYTLGEMQPEGRAVE